MRNNYVLSLSLEVRKASYIQRMINRAGTITLDVIVNNEPVYTSFDAGDAKQFCIDNNLSTRIKN